MNAAQRSIFAVMEELGCNRCSNVICGALVSSDERIGTCLWHCLANAASLSEVLTL